MVKEKEGKDGVFRRICVEGKTAGNISVERKDDVFCHDAELGYVLDRPYWSKGIMREAVRMITAEAMETLALARISAQVYSPNIASRPGAGAQRLSTGRAAASGRVERWHDLRSDPVWHIAGSWEKRLTICGLCNSIDMCLDIYQYKGDFP